MNARDQVLDDLVAQLRSSCRASVQVLLRQDDRLSLRIGSADSAVIDVRIKDAERPSFEVCYPALNIERNGRHHVKEVRAESVLVAGVQWIVGQLALHGVVRPEFE